MEPQYIYRAALDRVVDGDTYLLRLDLGFYAALTIRVRLHGIDVFEHNTSEGQLAIRYVQEVFAHAPDKILVQSYKDQRSFERWVCDVWVDGTLLADMLRLRGFEKPR